MNTGPWFAADAGYSFSAGSMHGKTVDTAQYNSKYQEVILNQANATGTFTFTQDHDLHGGSYAAASQGATGNFTLLLLTIITNIITTITNFSNFTNFY